MQPPTSGDILFDQIMASDFSHPGVDGIPNGSRHKGVRDPTEFGYGFLQQNKYCTWFVRFVLDEPAYIRVDIPGLFPGFQGIQWVCQYHNIQFDKIGSKLVHVFQYLVTPPHFFPNIRICHLSPVADIFFCGFYLCIQTIIILV